MERRQPIERRGKVNERTIERYAAQDAQGAELGTCDEQMRHARGWRVLEREDLEAGDVAGTNRGAYASTCSSYTDNQSVRSPRHHDAFVSLLGMRCAVTRKLRSLGSAAVASVSHT